MNAVTPIRIPVTDRAHWLGLRAECVITASTVAALFGAHPYETAHGCYLRAIGEGEETEESRAMLCGTLTELMIPELAASERPGLTLTKTTDFYRHHDLPFGGTPDFFDQDGGCWQAKSVNPFSFAKDWASGPPLHVLLQHQAELLLTGATTGGVIAQVRNNEYTTTLYDVPTHAATQQKILKAVSDFALRVDLREPPPMDYAHDAGGIAETYRYASKGKTLDLTSNNRLPELCAERIAAAAIEKDGAARKDAATAEILSIIQDADNAITQGFTISAPTVMTAEKPISAHIQPARAYRRLTIKES